MASPSSHAATPDDEKAALQETQRALVEAAKKAQTEEEERLRKVALEARKENVRSGCLAMGALAVVLAGGGVAAKLGFDKWAALNREKVAAAEKAAEEARKAKEQAEKEAAKRTATAETERSKAQQDAAEKAKETEFLQRKQQLEQQARTDAVTFAPIYQAAFAASEDTANTLLDTHVAEIVKQNIAPVTSDRIPELESAYRAAFLEDLAKEIANRNALQQKEAEAEKAKAEKAAADQKAAEESQARNAAERKAREAEAKAGQATDALARLHAQLEGVKKELKDRKNLSDAEKAEIVMKILRENGIFRFALSKNAAQDVEQHMAGQCTVSEGPFGQGCTNLRFLEDDFQSAKRHNETRADLFVEATTQPERRGSPAKKSHVAVIPIEVINVLDQIVREVWPEDASRWRGIGRYLQYLAEAKIENPKEFERKAKAVQILMEEELRRIIDEKNAKEEKPAEPPKPEPAPIAAPEAAPKKISDDLQDFVVRFARRMAESLKREWKGKGELKRFVEQIEQLLGKEAAREFDRLSSDYFDNNDKRRREITGEGNKSHTDVMNDLKKELEQRGLARGGRKAGFMLRSRNAVPENIEKAIKNIEKSLGDNSKFAIEPLRKVLTDDKAFEEARQEFADEAAPPPTEKKPDDKTGYLPDLSPTKSRGGKDAYAYERARHGMETRAALRRVLS